MLAMHRTSCLVPLLVVILVAGSWGSPALANAGAAQEASPDVSRDATFPITPAPAACTVDPRSPESLAALLGTPVADGAPGTKPSSFEVCEVPVGQLSDIEIEVGITATVLESTACFNANDSSRALALFSDAFLHGYVERNALTGEHISMLLTPGTEPVPAEVQTTILAVTDVTTLADGRTGAFVVTSSAWRGLDTSYTLFVQQGERWLIDEVIPFLAA